MGAFSFILNLHFYREFNVAVAVAGLLERENYNLAKLYRGK